jgi:hypothetical protein
MLDVDGVDVHRPQALRVIEQGPIPSLKRARPPTLFVALDDDAGDLSESLAGGSYGYGMTTLSERIAALCHGVAQPLGVGAGVGEGDGAGRAKAHLLLLAAERVAENPPLPAFVVGAQESVR